MTCDCDDRTKNEYVVKIRRSGIVIDESFAVIYTSTMLPELRACVKGMNQYTNKDTLYNVIDDMVAIIEEAQYNQSKGIKA